MGTVTGVMLICGECDGCEPPISAAIVEIQNWLAERWPGQPLKDVSRNAGGGKGLTFQSYSGGYKSMEEHDDEFVQFVATRLWCNPEAVLLVLQTEQEIPRVFRLDPLTPALRESHSTLQ